MRNIIFALALLLSGATIYADLPSSKHYMPMECHPVLCYTNPPKIAFYLYDEETGDLKESIYVTSIHIDSYGVYYEDEDIIEDLLECRSDYKEKDV